MKRIAILTSSRADYSIYLPLLKLLKKDPFFKLEIIAFGSHLSSSHGHTIDQILYDGFKVLYKIESLIAGDTQNAISTSMALTSLKFADFWRNHHHDFDIVFCLGDRYEMFAAVSAGIPFNISFAHIHGGEKTLGGIDNIFRHAITLASKYHFVSCIEHGKRVSELIETDENIYNIGAMSLDNLNSIKLYTKEFLHSKFAFDLNIPTILTTLHPESVSSELNEKNADEIHNLLIELKNYQVLISLPNADTFNSVTRKRLKDLPMETSNRIICVESLGTLGYFTVMKFCFFLLGNTSSGIIEAASFGKWVINVGDRQKGRIQSQNVINVPFDRLKILDAIRKIEDNPVYTGENVYEKGNAAENICTALKKIL